MLPAKGKTEGTPMCQTNQETVRGRLRHAQGWNPRTGRNMKTPVLPLLLLVVLLAPSVAGGVPRDPAMVSGTDPVPYLLCLDLMELEIPGDKGGEQLDLPPLRDAREPERKAPTPAVRTEPPAQPPSGVRSREEAAPPPAPGLSPLMLPEPERGRVGTRLPGEAAYPPPKGDLSTDLKPVAPPRSRPGELKVPAEGGATPRSQESAPDLPLLRRGQGGPRPLGEPGRDSVLTLKSATGGSPERTAPLEIGGGVSSDFSMRSGGVPEPIDPILERIYERYYKHR